MSEIERHNQQTNRLSTLHYIAKQAIMEVALENGGIELMDRILPSPVNEHDYLNPTQTLIKAIQALDTKPNSATPEVAERIRLLIQIDQEIERQAFDGNR